MTTQTSPMRTERQRNKRIDNGYLSLQITEEMLTVTTEKKQFTKQNNTLFSQRALMCINAKMA